jgi:hypothetical protein
MGDWVKRTLKLKENHGWEVKEGYKIFVADRGAVRFDFPENWVVVPSDSGSIKFHDRQPPDDDCTLELSVMYLPDEVDWSGLALATLVEQVTSQDTRKVLSRGRARVDKRDRLELAWIEIRFLDPNENREAYSRTCLARFSNIQPLITFDFWKDQAPKLVPVWDEVIRSLVLADYVEDPTQRVVDADPLEAPEPRRLDDADNVGDPTQRLSD